MLFRLLFSKTDIAPLVVFRIIFGILLSVECYGAILTGWVKSTLIHPQFTFSFIGFEWLQPLPGYGMYFYFLIMGTLGVCIALGYKYRFATITFTFMWAAVYLMQKTSYNNHYYLLILVSGLMACFPANRYFSVDVKQHPSIKKYFMPSWVKWTVVLQLFLVYTFAAVAKMYGDWLDFEVVKTLMVDKGHFPIIGRLLQQPLVHKIIGTGGILFDLLIIPALLWKRSRKFAFIASVFFHLFNSVVFQIGIFPYLSLAFSVFFFEPETIRNIFFSGKSSPGDSRVEFPQQRIVLVCLALYFALQLGLPLRHHFIKDDVVWTEEGHRMSWRMMLRSRTGMVKFQVVNKKTGESNWVALEDYISKKQHKRIGAYPDFIWQFAQYLKKEHNQKGEEVAIYAKQSKVSINGKPMKDFIDPTTDLAQEKWNHFRHHEWIILLGIL